MGNPRFPSEDHSGGQFLEYWIRYRGLSLNEICQRASVDPKILKRILEGKTPLLPAYLERVLNELGLSIQVNSPTEVNEDEL